MLKYLNARVALSRWLLLVAVLAILLGSTGCSLFGTHKKVQVPQLLAPLAEAKKTDSYRK